MLLKWMLLHIWSPFDSASNIKSICEEKLDVWQNFESTFKKLKNHL